MTAADLAPTRLTGSMVIGGVPTVGEGPVQHSVDPTTGARLEPGYAAASPAQVDEAARRADSAARGYRATDPGLRARFLDAIADELESVAEQLIARATMETALPVPRIAGEVGRTCGQLRLFATELRSGYFAQLRIDPAQPDRTPLPRADIRQRRIGVGPVVVFGASNFPLAFSTAGGDTASALAAGCPVIVKAHPAHLGTAEIVGAAIARAAAATNMPAGVFSQLVGEGNDTGSRLVADDRVRAVGFTGSRAGGLALARIAQNREVPIPVFAEMSSINPVVILPGALADNARSLAEQFAASLTLGAGQFCTNPGIILAVQGPDLDEFISAAAEAIRGGDGATMLTGPIRDAYAAGVRALRDAGARELATSSLPGSAAGASAHLLQVRAAEFAADPALRTEVFGATSLVVVCRDLDELAATIEGLEGQLTATVHTGSGDAATAAVLLPILEDLAGRIIFNGWPTGVEVGHAMVHGGPFPAATDGRTTSVGTAAIERFLRPVAYQDLPEELLPQELGAPGAGSMPVRLDGRVIAHAAEQETRR